MKPPDSFIKWLQAHPAVWEALQEHKLECWDFFMWEGDVYVVIAVGCDGVYANKYDNRAWSWFNTEEDLAGRSMWLPDLGQVVRMLQEAITQKDWETVPYLDVRWAEITLHFPSKEVAACVLGEDAEGQTRLVFIGTELFDTGCRDEPEIACTALWAKVKGVE